MITSNKTSEKTPFFSFLLWLTASEARNGSSSCRCSARWANLPVFGCSSSRCKHFTSFFILIHTHCQWGENSFINSSSIRFHHGLLLLHLPDVRVTRALLFSFAFVILFMKNRCFGGFFHWHRSVSSTCDVCRTVPSGWAAGLLLGTLVCKRDGAAAHHSRTLRGTLCYFSPVVYRCCVSLCGFFCAGASSEEPPWRLTSGSFNHNPQERGQFLSKLKFEQDWLWQTCAVLVLNK